MFRPSGWVRTGFWMTAALIAESAILPHWVSASWIPQVSFLILIFGALRIGAQAGLFLGFWLGCCHAFLGILSPGTIILLYAALGLAAGSAKNFVFLESPLAQWLVPPAFALLLELVYFFMMPWDDKPWGVADYFGMVRASNWTITALASGWVYGWYDRRVVSFKAS